MNRPLLPRLAHARPGRATLLGLLVGLPLAAGALLVARAAFADVPPVPFPPENPFSEEKRILGKILFFDEQLSTSSAVACASCHSFAVAGADPRLARNPGDDNVLNTPDDVLGSPGVVKSDPANDFSPDPAFALRPQITARAANSPINAAFSPLLFWDGRAANAFTDPQTGQVAIANRGALESQSLQPVVNTVEMAHAGTDYSDLAQRLAHVDPLNLATNHPADIAAVLATRPGYPELFRRAFGDDQINARRIAFAIATYQRTLISDQAPYDRFRDGQQNALTAAQQRGLQAFQSQGSRCNACHSLQADLFTDHSFRNIGLRPIAEDNGRQAITNAPQDAGRFKVPGLRNVGLRRSFMHNGQFASLTDVLRFYARAPGAAPQFPQNQDPIIPQIQLPPNAAADIQDFLANGLTDPRVVNRSAPFDAPTLFGQRQADQPTILGGGSPGSGGQTPRIIAPDPAMIGNRDFRLGLDNALGAAQAQLGLSLSPPVNGRITPFRTFDPQTTGGAGPGAGFATLHWPLLPGEAAAGQVLFAQWIVTDPAAAGGRAFSAVARIPVFCGSSGCPTPCSPADVNADGFLDFFDYDLYLDLFDGGDPKADMNNDAFIDFFDYDDFIAAYESGCP